jgi:hypothetical protein
MGNVPVCRQRMQNGNAVEPSGILQKCKIPEGLFYKVRIKRIKFLMTIVMLLLF